MGSASVVDDDASQKELDRDLLDAGNRLLMLRSSTVDELLILLQKTESILAKVWQQPPASTAKSLLPIMKALVTLELLRHAHESIQIAVASCMNELTRITAPDAPYPDDVMKVIFELFMVPLKQLSCESACNYSVPLKILEYMAKVKSCVLMMDLDSDDLIVDMFQLFLTTIRSDHPPDVFKYMQMVMTMMIKENDEISLELLNPLLASVKMDNKNISPISWMLGKTILENSATKLQPFIREAVKAWNLNVNDYAKIVISLCRDTSNGKHMVESPPVSKPTKTKYQNNLPREKEKKRRRSLVDYDDELVNSRIKVWWPMDQVFYPGTVAGFDPVTKKHKVRYDDNEIEHLDLIKERWTLFNDEFHKNPNSEHRSFDH